MSKIVIPSTILDRKIQRLILISSLRVKWSTVCTWRFLWGLGGQEIESAPPPTPHPAALIVAGLPDVPPTPQYHLM